MNTQTAQPWYREPWPWILMAGPATVIVAGVITTWIAFATFDGLVADDYYRQGRAINQELKRTQRATELGLAAGVVMGEGRLRVTLSGAKPEVLLAHLAHATRAGHDRHLRLAPTGGGAYEAAVPPLPAGRWKLILEDPHRQWRIAKDGR